MSNNRSYMNDPAGWIFAMAVLRAVALRLGAILAAGAILWLLLGGL